MAYYHCKECDGGMRCYTLREALIDRKQKCPRCHHMNELTVQDGFELLVENWEETHYCNGEWEVRNDM